MPALFEKGVELHKWPIPEAEAIEMAANKVTWPESARGRSVRRAYGQPDEEDESLCTDSGD